MDNIDYQAITEQLQHENEQLRAQLMKSKLTQFALKHISISRKDVVETLQDKRFWVGVLL